MALPAHSEPRFPPKCESSLLRMPACKARRTLGSQRLEGTQPLQLGTKLARDRLSHAHSAPRSQSKRDRLLPRKQQCRARRDRRSRCSQDTDPRLLDTTKQQGSSHLDHSAPRSRSRLARLPPRTLLCTPRTFLRNRYPQHNRPRLPDTRRLQGMQHLGHSGLRSQSKCDRLLLHIRLCRAGRNRRS